jgi:hypothetical protein
MASHWVSFTLIFILASGLLLTGFFLAWYPHSVIESLESRLDESDLSQPQRDWFQSSLIWWNNEGVFTYGSVSNFVILSGILVLVYAIVYSLISTWRESIRAKLTYARQLPQDRLEGKENDRFQNEQTRKVVKTGFPVASGILTIIASCIIILFSGIFVAGSIVAISSRYTAQSVNLLGDGLFGITVFGFSLTGGIMALKRKNFVFSIIGMCFMAVKGATFIIATNDFLGVSIGIVILALTVLSLIFTSISYKEFS